MNELSIVLGADRPDLIREETLSELFRRSAHEYPDNTALIFHDQSLTYTELDRWSDAVALYLKEKGIGPKSNVGVWWQRGLELHVIILGIVKAGAAYVPVDREIPAERVEVILQEVGAAACFSMQQLNVDCEMLVVPAPSKSPTVGETLAATAFKVFQPIGGGALAGMAFNEVGNSDKVERNGEFEPEPGKLQKVSATGGDLEEAELGELQKVSPTGGDLEGAGAGAGPLPFDCAYVLYTSGSTGKPKGIPISHQQICHLVRSEQSILQIRPADKVYQGFSVSFDMWCEETWISYFAGAALWVSDNITSKAVDELSDVLRKEKITVLHAVPSLLAVIEDSLPSLRLVNAGGEACTPQVLAKWAKEGRRFF